MIYFSQNRLEKYSTLLIAIVAISLVQFIQCYENWISESQKNSGYYGEGLQNFSFDSRDFSKDVEGNSKPVFNNIVAYHKTLHNVSWAVTIPVFTFLLPIAESGDPVTLGNQALYGFFAAVIIIIGYAIPILFNGYVPHDLNGQRSLSRENNKIALNHLMHPGHLMNLVGINFQNQLGVDPVQCLQKTVCEAHRSPQNERYGILAKPFQYFFPAKDIPDSSMQNIYQIAARDGKFRGEACGKKYECMFDVLDLASYFLSVYKRSRAKAKIVLGQKDDENVGNKLF